MVEALGVRGPCTVQVFRDRDIGLGITDVNTRFGGAFPAPDVRGAARAHLPGADRRAWPRGESVEPHVGEFRAGVTFTRYYWQLELDENLEPDRPRHRRAARPAGSRGDRPPLARRRR